MIFRICMWDADLKLACITQYLNKSNRILDIGTGPGSVSLQLSRDGFNVISLDVEDLSLTPEVHPLIYDGNRLPFNDGDFDVALLLTVLHHTPYPKQILLEAVRVAPRIIIIEDIYRSRLGKGLTFFADSVANLEFRGHPHSNKTDDEWRTLFHQLGLRLVDAHDQRFLLFFRQITYCIER